MLQDPGQFQERTRGVTVVIGVVLLLGITVIAFSGYQAYQVPEQNAEREFRHAQAVEDDMTELYTAVQQASADAVTGREGAQFATVDLGTQYRDRAVAINPPPVTGTLGTTDRHEIVVDVDGIDETNETTRFIEYQPEYNQLPSDALRIEYGILYLDPDTQAGDEIVVREHELVDATGGDITLQIPTVTTTDNTVERGADSAATEAVPVDDVAGNTDGAEETITLPTQLPKDTWETLLEEELDAEVPEGALTEDEGSPNAESDTITDLEIDLTALPVDEVEFTRVGIDLGSDTPFQGDVSGVVEDEEGEPVADVEVTFTAEANEGETEDSVADMRIFGEAVEETIELNEDGEYTLRGLTEGTYDITASRDGSVDDTVEEIEITAGQETENVDFTLGEITDPPEEFESVSVSNLVAGSDDESQTFEFEIDGELVADQEVTIDLDDAFVDSEVEYPQNVEGQGDISITEGTGEVEYDVNQGQEEATITYTADNEVSSGDTIGIELEGIDVDDVTEEYVVTFETLGGDIEETTEFRVRDESAFVDEDLTLEESRSEDIIFEQEETTLTLNGDVTQGGEVIFEEADGEIAFDPADGDDALIEGPVTAADGFQTNIEPGDGGAAEIQDDVDAGASSHIELSPTDGGDAEIDGTVSVGKDSEVVLGAGDGGSGVITGDLELAPDATVEKESGDGDEGVVEGDILDADGNELDCDDEQVDCS